MKAAQIDGYGDVSAIQVRDTEKPIVRDDQVLIKVGAGGLNPFDLMVLSGQVQSMAPLDLPATLGSDIAGTIAEVGSKVTNFAVGDRVYGTANAIGGASGAFAEFATTPATSIGHAPNNSSDSEAASLPTAGISALQAINTLNIQNGQRIFIHGGAGGVGSVAIQIAKARGAYVIATASAANKDFVTALGADEVIDYKAQDFRELVHDADAMLNTVRSDDSDDLLGTLKRGGVAVSMTGPFDETKAAELGVTATAQQTHVTTEALEELRDLVEQSAVHTSVDRSYPLDQVQAAYTTLGAESVRGKIVITSE